MDSKLFQQLQRLNRRFYRRKAQSFSETRRKPWPGWLRLSPILKDSNRILDLGCGNGRFAAFWSEQTSSPADLYLGLDSSVDLLAEAKVRFGDSPFRWLAADVLSPLPIRGSFDSILLLAVLHHLPGHETRIRVLQTLLAALSPGGHLAISLWRRDVDPRMARRNIPWSRLNVDDRQLEPGDSLLSFQGDAENLRYCHLFDEAEVDELAKRIPATLVDRFRADGQTGEQNEYLVFRKED